MDAKHFLPATLILLTIFNCERDGYRAERDRYKLQAELLASQLAGKERTIQILLKQTS